MKVAAILDRTFYELDALIVAEELIGTMLVCKQNGRERRYMITETEAYIGPHDKACHAHKGKTKRTEVMFGPAGHWYIYFVYGMYWMLNIVTGEEGYPSAVLIRGVEGINGPGKLTRDVSIGKSFNAKPATMETGLWIEEGKHMPSSQIARTARIGIAYAKEWKDKPYRFVLKD